MRSIRDMAQTINHCRRSGAALFDYFADLHHAGDVGVMRLIGDELGGGCRECRLQIVHGEKEKVTDGVVRSRRSRRKAPDSAIDLGPHQAALSQQPSRKLKMLAE